MLSSGDDPTPRFAFVPSATSMAVLSSAVSRPTKSVAFPAQRTQRRVRTYRTADIACISSQFEATVWQ